MVMAGWSVHLPHFFLGKLEQADNKYFPHILSLVLQAKVKSVTQGCGNSKIIYLSRDK